MIRNHNLTPPRKKLPPLVKVQLATATLAAVLSDRMSEKDAGRALREGTGTQWSLLTCMQYLSGKEELGAIANLPADWTEDRRCRLSAGRSGFLEAIQDPVLLQRR